MFFFFCCFFGCEVYFGDVFYFYFCFFECVVKMNDKYGGGFMIVFFVIEIQGGDVFVYIFINVIFIIDGQIFLEVEFFYKGICFVINVGFFVFCVGFVV